MSHPVIKAEGLSKRYVSYASEMQRFAAWFGLNSKPKNEFWAVSNVSFEIPAGQSLALVGPNGAGKSTLLKMIAKTVIPTTGAVHITGRVSAILELGLGFNSDFTGRENIYNSGGMMGYSPEELKDLIKPIEDFAELGPFFDKPLRQYSSGMYARLAFSLATATRPDVLIIDEVLSVGDTYFQHKSFARIKEFRKAGTSIIMVSHSKESVQELCERAILLEGGKILQDGPPSQVFDYYNAMIADREAATISVNKLDNNTVQTVSGSGAATLQTLHLENKKGQIIEQAETGDAVKLVAKISVESDIAELVFGFQIKDRLGQIIYGTNTHLKDCLIKNAKTGDQYSIALAFNNHLGVGSYSVSTGLHSGPTHIEENYEWKDLALVFTVGNAHHEHFVGSTWLNGAFTIDKTNS